MRTIFAVFLFAGCATAGPIEFEPADASTEVHLDASVIDAMPDVPIDAAPIMKTLSETATQDVLSVHTISCNNTLETAENHYYRVFPLAMFGVVGTFHVSRVDFGVELVQGAQQVATVNVGRFSGTITTTTTGFSLGALNGLATTNVPLINGNVPRSMTVPITAEIDAADSLYVEVVTPSQLGTTRAAVLGS